MTSNVPPSGRAAAMHAHLTGVEIIREMMRRSQIEPRKMGDLGSMKVGEPDAAMLERMKAAQAASDARALTEEKIAARPGQQAPAKPEAPPADQDPRYSETTRWALGVASTARKDLELLATYVRVFNSAKAAIEDPAHLETIRGRIGDERLAAYVAQQRNNMVGYGSTAQEMAANISRSYSVSASPLATDASGFLSITDFTMKKTGPSWNLTIASSGAATVFADGADVSALVDNRKMSGGVWIQRAPGQSTEVVA